MLNNGVFMKKLYLLLFIIFTNLPINAQENLLSKFGFEFGYGINMHNSEFSNVGIIPSCCPIYDGGNGNGFSLGLFYELPLAKSFSLGLKTEYASLDAVLENDELKLFGDDGNKVQGNLNYRIDSKINKLALIPYASIRFSSKLSLNLGFSLDYLNKADMNQREKISSPDNLVFKDNNSNTRNIYDGEIDGLNALNYSIYASIKYDFFLDKSQNYCLTPSISANYGLSDIAKNTNWSINSIRFNIGFAYNLIEEETIPEPKKELYLPKQNIVKQKPATPYKPKSAELKRISDLKLDISAVGVNDNGLETPDLQVVRIEEFLSTNVQPLLSYIFFDENSYEIPNRLEIISSSETNQFGMNSLKNLDALETYKKILNIIGWRLNQIKDADLTITGCNSDENLEKSNLNLSEKRAEILKSYLTNVWNINTDRIKIQKRNLPEKPSSSAHNDGIQENRRAEFSSNDERILEPVIIEDTLRTANPPILRFKTSFSSSVPIKEWRLFVLHEGQTIKEFDGKGSIPPQIDWLLSKDLTNSSINWKKVEFVLTAKDNDNNENESDLKSINVNAVSIQKKRDEGKKDKSIDKYSLILFDFNSAELTAPNKKIANMIKQKISSDADINIYGYADRSGIAQRNQQLAEDRAKASANAINRPDSKIHPIGSSQFIYDNNLPEGRFYSRTVTIIVESTISNKE